MNRLILLCTGAVMVLFPVVDLVGQTWRTNGNSVAIEDLDPNDGFDFVGEYSGPWTIKFARGNKPPILVSNDQIDGGSRTVYQGVKVVDLAFESNSGTLDLIDSTIIGEYVYWDRANFNQHIFELNFSVGNSTFSLVITADQNDGDTAHGELFNVNSPKPNTGSITLFGFADKLEAEMVYSDPQFLVNGNASEFGGAGSIVGEPTDLNGVIILGDINLDDAVNLLDVQPFIALLTNGHYQAEGDING